MFGEAAGAISGAKAAFDLAKGINALKSETERNLAVIEIQRILLEVQESALADKERIAALNREIEDFRRQISSNDEWQALASRYRLTKSTGGAYTYDLLDEFSAAETFHRICAACFEDKKRSILHVKNKHSGGEIVYCARCDKDLKLSPFTNRVVISDYNRYDDL
ncbi:hypothetical protein [Sphingopyxis sp. R3-92]|uniref:hypothetical protein n=1 Tax=Sphingopyxis sp. R3-92 TaxID=3158553 RepID=UPI003EE711AC